VIHCCEGIADHGLLGCGMGACRIRAVCVARDYGEERIRPERVNHGLIVLGIDGVIRGDLHDGGAAFARGDERYGCVHRGYLADVRFLRLRG
jgi:hypothetical protein